MDENHIHGKIMIDERNLHKDHDKILRILEEDVIIDDESNDEFKVEVESRWRQKCL